jgi:hypothetical protein
MEISHNHLLSKPFYPHNLAFKKVPDNFIFYFKTSKIKMIFLKKMEALVLAMQHPTSGVPVKTQKLFLTTITNAFTGTFFSY